MPTASPALPSGGDLSPDWVVSLAAAALRLSMQSRWMVFSYLSLLDIQQFAAAFQLDVGLLVVVHDSLRKFVENCFLCIKQLDLFSSSKMPL